MCKVLQDIGLITEHGSKALKFQKIVGDNKEKTLAFVSYKDGMTIKVYEYTKDEIRNLMELLCEYLDYHPVFETETEVEVDEVEDNTDDAEVVEEKEEKRDIVKTLVTLPSGDCNYQTALREANTEEIAAAITIMKESGGRHQTRIKACENAIARKEKGLDKPVAKTETKVEVTNIEPKEEKPKVVEFPTEDKKPKIIPLHTDGDRTYGECVVKVQKEMEVFGSDSDSEYVLTGLLELAKVDQDFRNNFMREDKTYASFMEFMFKAAQNGYCVKYGNVGWLDRDKGLALAIEYYNADIEQMNAEEEAKRKAEAEKRKAEAEALKAKTKKGAKKNGKNVGKKKGRTTA